jgi:hypothetical protein
MHFWVFRGAVALLAGLLVVVTVPGTGEAPASNSPSSPIAPSVAADAAPTAANPFGICPGIPEPVLAMPPAPFVTRTAADVVAGLKTDPWVRHLFNDLAGVRPGPLRDPRVPLCRPDLIALGEPTFVRQFPATTGRWLVPVRYEAHTLVTMFVGRDADGMGTVGGNRGGGIPIPSEAVARAAGAGPSDPVVSAELVFANASCGTDLVTWRLVRRSGVAVYLVPEFPGAPPPGALLKENEVWFRTSGGRPPFALARPAAAC